MTIKKDVFQIEREIKSISERNKYPPIGNGFFSEFKNWPKSDQVKYNKLLDTIKEIEK